MLLNKISYTYIFLGVEGWGAGRLPIELPCFMPVSAIIGAVPYKNKAEHRMGPAHPFYTVQVS